ncbi:unnamed protein product [Mytilus edulis]|uniref:Autophagy-related protein 27 n=1 Tax=Mytilus edulis TaxID=6550 RepID=A0A8S3RDJ2_MYTED|nr:unnamed protein product [Mytilus edulis]
MHQFCVFLFMFYFLDFSITYAAIKTISLPPLTCSYGFEDYKINPEHSYKVVYNGGKIKRSLNKDTFLQHTYSCNDQLSDIPEFCTTNSSYHQDLIINFVANENTASRIVFNVRNGDKYKLDCNNTLFESCKDQGENKNQKHDSSDNDLTLPPITCYTNGLENFKVNPEHSYRFVYNGGMAGKLIGPGLYLGFTDFLMTKTSEIIPIRNVLAWKYLTSTVVLLTSVYSTE